MRTLTGHNGTVAPASDVLQAIRQLEGGQQLTVLQELVANMGYGSPNGIAKVKEPVVPPRLVTPRKKVSIKGIDNVTVHSYMEKMNAFDFQGAVALFAEDGALQPPFEKAIVGQQDILAYMRDECYGLKLMPERGVCVPAEGGFSQIKVTGKVQTPWFGSGVSINLAWRFLLNAEEQIFFVAIDLLASAQELLNLGLVQYQRGIEKLERQLQGQLVEARGLLKDVVDEMQIFAPEAIADVKADFLQIFNKTFNDI